MQGNDRKLGARLSASALHGSVLLGAVGLAFGLLEGTVLLRRGVWGAAGPVPFLLLGALWSSCVLAMLGVVGGIGLEIVAWILGRRLTARVRGALLVGAAAGVFAVPYLIVAEMYGSAHLATIWTASFLVRASVSLLAAAGISGGMTMLIAALWRRFKPTGRAALVLMAALAIVWVAVEVERPSPPPPSDSRPINVLLITIDCLRPDHLGAYGYGRGTSPRIDELAMDGVTFERAYATAPYTLSSLPSFLTGRYVFDHGVRKMGWPLPDSVPTLAASLRDAGYRTIMAGDRSQEFAYYGFGRGFETIVAPYLFDHSPLRRLLNRRVPAVSGPLVDRSGISKTLAMIRAFGSDRQRPFFGWIHLYWDAHVPYNAPPPFGHRFTDRGYAGPAVGKLRYLESLMRNGRTLDGADQQHLLDLYDGDVAFADHQVGMMIDALALQGELDRTLVIVSSDHGESFGEGGYFLHTYSLQEPQIRIPLVLRLPGRFDSGQRRTDLASSVDIFPTVAAATGVPVPAGVQGEDLFTVSPRQEVFSETYRYSPLGPQAMKDWNYQIAMVTSKEKTLVCPACDEILEETIRPGLTYAEAIPVADATGAAERFLQAINRITAKEMDSFSALAPQEDGDLSPEVLERLRALGYLN